MSENTFKFNLFVRVPENVDVLTTLGRIQKLLDKGLCDEILDHDCSIVEGYEPMTEQEKIEETFKRR